MHYFSGYGCSELAKSMHYCIGIFSLFTQKPPPKEWPYVLTYQIISIHLNIIPPLLLQYRSSNRVANVVIPDADCL